MSDEPQPVAVSAIPITLTALIGLSEDHLHIACFATFREWAMHAADAQLCTTDKCGEIAGDEQSQIYRTFMPLLAQPEDGTLRGLATLTVDGQPQRLGVFVWPEAVDAFMRCVETETERAHDR